MDLDSATVLPQVKELTLQGTHPDLSALDSFPQLESLAIWNYPYGDIRQLPFLPTLTKLEIYYSIALNCGDVNLGPLGGTRGLRVHYDNSTRLYNTEELGEGSAVQEMTKAIADGIWPFNNERA